MLPFKTAKKQTKVVKDGLGNSLEVPCFGSATYNEAQEFYAIVNEQKDSSNALFMNAIVAMFLRRRFPEALNLSDEEILSCGGEPIAFTLVTALYEFFVEQELNGGIKESKKKLNPPLPTGEISTTDLDSTIPTNLPSVQKTLATVP